ncbi:MAG: flavin monoamine oxidase family protein [Chloroflexota bacterium]|nr:flavin monoamine oxidase family protein [Chloroflexota bacterium]
MSTVPLGTAPGRRGPITRRRFIQAVAAVGGTTAAWSAMSAWGHLAEAKQTAPPTLPGESSGARIIILGAGPAGLVAGYELGRKGYDVQILEADDRVGGHVFTVRRGSRTHELGGEEQICDFDEGQWYDAGAWRIPYVHRGIHHYLREFQIPTIHHTDINMNAYSYVSGIRGPLNERPVRLREAIVDMRGYTAELLAKGLNQDQLDQELSQEDRDAFIAYLISVGLLSADDLSYQPNVARGWSGLDLAADQREVPTAPFPLEDLLPFAEAAGDLTPLGDLLHQPVMQKPANGMSQIFEEGFQPQLADRLTLGAEVREVRQSESGVEIIYFNKSTGETNTATADYCISTIPLSVLNRMRTDLSGPIQEAIQGSAYSAVGKLGLQFGRRFWEEDDWIYGGLTITNVPEIGTISYPTWDYHTPKGVLQGYYNFGNTAMTVSRLSLQDRIELGLEFGSKIHPQYRQEYEAGFSVAWHRMPYAMGGWAGWSDYAKQHFYPRLFEPDGRIYFAGDFMSQIPGWIEGAIQAAWLQIDKLHQRVMQAA